jgi:hypothetical protein
MFLKTHLVTLTFAIPLRVESSDGAKKIPIKTRSPENTELILNVPNNF